jgi:predicted phage terminase large subunit-like protein
MVSPDKQSMSMSDAPPQIWTMRHSPDLSPQVAAAELLARRIARRDLLGFTRYTHGTYTPAPHHERICTALEAVARGDTKRLMVFMPPRHGKSELASRRFPAWYLGAYPKHQIIAASYNSELASDFGREVRNIVGSREYRVLFDTALAADSQAANRWHTSAGGSYVAAGVGTAITGRGAHVLLIDDPIKDREEADSSTVRDRVWDWYTSTAYTRLMPGGAIVVIQTRWHEDDLAGRLLTAQARTGGDTWDVLELKAIDDDGNALWPEWYPVPELERIRSVIGPRDWSALYQQSPVPDGKAEFSRDWLCWYHNTLKGDGMNVYLIVDPAGEKKKTSDRTAMWVVGLNSDGNYYLLDFVYDRLSLSERAREVMRLHRKWKPVRVGYEKYGKDSDIEAIKMVQDRDNYRFEIVPLGGSLKKEDRIRRLVPLFEQRKVYMPPTMHRTLSDGRTVDFIEQLLVEEYDRFPVGAHDDGMDCLARITDADLNAVFPMIEAEPERYRRNRRSASGSAWAS